MIRRLGTAGPALEAALRKPLIEVTSWLERRSDMPSRFAKYHSLLADPAAECTRIREFPGVSLDVAAMAAQVYPSLHRQKS